MKRFYFLIPLVPISVFLLFAAVFLTADDRIHAPEFVGATAQADLVSPDGSEMGTVIMTQGPTGIVVAAEVQGLTPGGHAMTINSVGSCVPNFEAAGGDFQPHGGNHGFLQGNGPHAGDLPNIYAWDDGTARADFFAVELTFNIGLDHSLFDEDGSAIVIHEKLDVYVGGDLGERIACGVIQRN
ncbi:MAG: superoxide dismutase family protein [Chloroflexi bacterium]|nr:superoxide dismutase family protein [Chloroflexota bacterium]